MTTTNAPVIQRTSRRLADGREIIHFDDSGAPPRRTDDSRDLPDRASADTSATTPSWATGSRWPDTA